LLLRFSDGAWGVFDFSHYQAANTEMTAPLRDPGFFAKHFIEAGALAWPNGFDSARSRFTGACKKLAACAAMQPLRVFTVHSLTGTSSHESQIL
jgi:hypothetical protein